MDADLRRRDDVRSVRMALRLDPSCMDDTRRSTLLRASAGTGLGPSGPSPTWNGVETRPVGRTCTTQRNCATVMTWSKTWTRERGALVLAQASAGTTTCTHWRHFGWTTNLRFGYGR